MSSFSISLYGSELVSQAVHKLIQMIIRGGSRLFVKGVFEFACMSLLYYCKSQSAIAINNFRAEGGF